MKTPAVFPRRSPLPMWAVIAAITLPTGSIRTVAASSYPLSRYGSPHSPKPSPTPTTRPQASHRTLDDAKRTGERRSRATTARERPASSPSPDTACRLFVWDLVSAAKYRYCQQALRAATYEGRGGKKFIRIRPGSLLEALYPCTRHSPDKCVICGMSFQDHLNQWWKPHVGTPFDLWLDRVQDRDTKNTADGDGGARMSSLGNKRPLTSESESEPGGWSFHKLYVEEVPENVQSYSARRSKRTRQEDINPISPDLYEVRKLEDGISYRVPKYDRKGMGGLWSAYLLFMARNIALDHFDEFLTAQQHENNRRKNSSNE